MEARQGITLSEGSVDIANANQLVEFAKLMSAGNIAVPKHLRENPGACLAVCVQAHEWKMSPFSVANKSYSVNDRLAYEAQLVYAVILRRAPIRGRFKVSYSGEGGDRRCKVIATLTDGGTVDYESPKTKDIPVKNSPLWKSDPDQQLFYYTVRACCRRHFPDVLLGVYTPEEIEHSEPQVRNVTPKRRRPNFGDRALKEPEPEQIVEEEAPESSEDCARRVLEEAGITEADALKELALDDWEVGASLGECSEEALNEIIARFGKEKAQ